MDKQFDACYLNGTIIGTQTLIFNAETANETLNTSPLNFTVIKFKRGNISFTLGIGELDSATASNTQIIEPTDSGDAPFLKRDEEFASSGFARYEVSDDLKYYSGVVAATFGTGTDKTACLFNFRFKNMRF